MISTVVCTRKIAPFLCEKRTRVLCVLQNIFVGHKIRGGGTLVLGQEQDSLGGSFDKGESFCGQMTGVNIWDRVIPYREILRLSRACRTGTGNVFQWGDFKAHVNGSVEIVNPSCR